MYNIDDPSAKRILRRSLRSINISDESSVFHENNVTIATRIVSSRYRETGRLCNGCPRNIPSIGVFLDRIAGKYILLPSHRLALNPPHGTGTMSSSSVCRTWPNEMVQFSWSKIEYTPRRNGSPMVLTVSPRAMMKEPQDPSSN